MRMSWRAAAIVALALNLLLLGGVGGLLLGGLRIVPAEGRGDIAGPRGESVPPEARARLRRALAEVWRNSSAERREMRDSRLAVVEAVEREPYDAAAVEAAFARMRAADSLAQAKVHAALAQSLTGFPPETRAAAVRMVARRFSGGRSREEGRPPGAPQMSPPQTSAPETRPPPP